MKTLTLLVLLVTGIAEAAPLPPPAVALLSGADKDGDAVCKLAELIYQAPKPSELHPYEKNVLEFNTRERNTEVQSLRRFLVTDTEINEKEVLQELVRRIDLAATKSDCTQGRNDLKDLSARLALSAPESYAEIVHLEPRGNFSEIGKDCGSPGQRWFNTLSYAAPFMDHRQPSYSKLIEQYVKYVLELPEDGRGNALDNLATLHLGSAFAPELKALIPALKKRAIEFKSDEDLSLSFQRTVAFIDGGAKYALKFLDESAKKAMPLNLDRFQERALDIMMTHADELANQPTATRWFALRLEQAASSPWGVFTNQRITKLVSILEARGPESSHLAVFSKVKARLADEMKSDLALRQSTQMQSLCDRAFQLRNAWVAARHLERLTKK